MVRERAMVVSLEVKRRLAEADRTLATRIERKLQTSAATICGEAEK